MCKLKPGRGSITRLALTHLLLLISAVSFAATYFVDSRNGNDSRSGMTEKDAWQTLIKVNQFKFRPGDSICFRRNSVFTGELTITSSGTPGHPVTFTTYGDGTNPIIKNPGVQMGSAIRINANWVVVEDFLVRDAHEAGIYISAGAEHNIIRYVEATNVGIGIAIHGKHNLVTRNYAHDLTMVRNTKGGDDDFGAVGIWLFSSANEVSYNRMLNCKAPSYDYGNDGGVVEFYGDVDSCYIHHNLGENCDGSFEVGGQGETLSHNLIAYNIYINNGVAGGFHVGGTFGVHFEDLRVENNTFIDTGTFDYAVGLWNGHPANVDIRYTNNIFYIPRDKHIFNQPGITHDHNLFYLGGKNDPDFKPGSGEITGDPQFMDFSRHDFHLRAGSPAIDGGADLGYRKDFEGNEVPQGKAPEIGAFEFKP